MSEALAISRIVLTAFYAASALAYAAVFTGFWPSKTFRATGLLLATILLHIAYLASISLLTTHPPVYSIWDVAGVLALAVALVYLYVESRMREKTTGVFIACLSAALMALSAAAYDPSYVAEPVVAANRSILLHIAPAIIAYAGFTVSFILSCLYLMLHVSIKKNRFGIVFDKLPPLETLGDMNRRSVEFGVLFLGLSICMGAVFSAKAFDMSNILDSKVLSVAAGWAVFVSAAALARFRVLSRVKLAILSIMGFVVLLASVAVVNPFFGKFHKFG